MLKISIEKKVEDWVFYTASFSMKLHQRGSLINLKDLITKNEFIIKNEIKRLSAMSEKLFHFLFNPLSTILFDKGGLFAKEELHPLFLIQQSVFFKQKGWRFFLFFFKFLWFCVSHAGCFVYFALCYYFPESETVCNTQYGAVVAQL